MNTMVEKLNEPGTTGATEGRVARAIERRTAKVPSDLFLWAAGGVIIGSLALQALTFGRPVRRLGGRFMTSPRFGNLSLFVGQWAPTLLVLGLYNKIVKVMGSERR